MPPLTEPVSRTRAPLGIRQRLILALALPLILILIVSSYLDYRLAQKTTNSAYDQALADAVFDLESHIRQQGSPPYFDLTEEAEAMLRSNAPDKLYFSIRTGDGKLVAGDEDLPLPKRVHYDQVSFHDGMYRGEEVRGALLWMQMADGDIGITVMETTIRRQQSSHRILTAMLLQNLLVIVMSMLAVFLGIRQGLSPLRDLEQEIAARSVDDLREIELASVPAEIRSLLQRLNELFSLVREAVQVQQRFIADAAHQLRTPLAGLQTQLDLAANEGVFRDHVERLANIEEASSRIGHLLSQLLTYARAETPASGVEVFEAVALEQLGEKSATEFIDAALAKDIDLGFEMQPATTQGLAWMLQEALANLVDNAIRYTPSQGVITVRSGVADGHPYLEVEDNGPGIPETHLRLVIERFYRVPGSPGDGCGLGLAIVNEIAKLHRGELQLLPSALGGLCVRMVFPVLPLL
jgi:two-component system sensor histidine kinase TctE